MTSTKYDQLCDPQSPRSAKMNNRSFFDNKKNLQTLDKLQDPPLPHPTSMWT